MPDHPKGLLLLAGAAKEKERQDCNRQPDGSPYENPLLLVFRTPALFLMGMLLFKVVGVELVLALVFRVRDLEGFSRYFGFLDGYCNRRCLQLQSLGHRLRENRKIGWLLAPLVGDIASLVTHRRTPRRIRKYCGASLFRPFSGWPSPQPSQEH